MPHFNDQYPSMEEIRQKRQEELEYENNSLLKEQNELLRELLGRGTPVSNNSEDTYKTKGLSSDLRDMYETRRFVSLGIMKNYQPDSED